MLILCFFGFKYMHICNTCLSTNTIIWSNHILISYLLFSNLTFNFIIYFKKFYVHYWFFWIYIYQYSKHMLNNNYNKMVESYTNLLPNIQSGVLYNMISSSYTNPLTMERYYYNIV